MSESIDDLRKELNEHDRNRDIPEPPNAQPHTLLTNGSYTPHLLRWFGLRRGRYRCVEGPAVYRGGIWWNFQDFAMTLLDGYFPPGSVWEFQKDGRRYAVRGNEDLQDCPPPEDDPRWERQSLELVDE